MSSTPPGAEQVLAAVLAEAARDLEEQLRETGRQRARADAAEQLLERFLEQHADAVVDDRDVLWHARVLLGVDGCTGSRYDDPQVVAGRG